MISLKNVRTVAKKELRSYFDGPAAYVILAAFLFLWEFLFFRGVFQSGEASLRQMFGTLPWLCVLFLPAITMNSVSQEQNEGTIEMLLTHPLRDWELILGKFLGASAFFASALAFAVPVAASLSRFGNLDWGVVTAQLLGSLLMGMVLISLGIFVSSLFKSPVTSLLVSAVGAFFLIVVGSDLVAGILPSFVAPLMSQLSLSTHFELMARGVIDLRDAWYFVSATAVFLLLTLLRLHRRRYGNRRLEYGRFRLGIALLVGIVLLSDIVGMRIPVRIDLTGDERFTLSDATRRTLEGLPDVVTVDVYASARLPAQFQPILRDARDILSDYQTYGRGNVTVAFKDPTNRDDIAAEARTKGVDPIRFNVFGQNEYQQQTGFLGLAISYAGKSEALPVIQNTGDLEYKLTSLIKKMTDAEKKKIAYLSGHGETITSESQKILAEVLGNEFELSDVDLSAADASIPPETSAVIVGGPTEAFDEPSRKALRDYLSGGGSALFLIDAFGVSADGKPAIPNSNSLADFLKDYGVTVNEDLAYDLRSNETIQWRDGNSVLLTPYPFWINAIAGADGEQLLGGGRGPMMPWTSSLALDEEVLATKGFSAAKLLVTTEFGGTNTDGTINPSTEVSAENLGSKLLAVGLTSNAEGTNGQKTRILVVGNSRFVSDDALQSATSNVALAAQLVGMVAQEDSIAALRLRRTRDLTFRFENDAQPAAIQYGNLALAVLLPLVLGFVRLMRRRRLTRQTYSLSSNESV